MPRASRAQQRAEAEQRIRDQRLTFTPASDGVLDNAALVTDADIGSAEALWRAANRGTEVELLLSAVPEDGS